MGSVWQAIPYVTSVLTLIAFIVAALLLAYRSRLQHRANIIRSAPQEKRIEAIAITAEFFRVDVSDLPPKQKEEIVLAQIRMRARRDLVLASLAVAIAFLLAAVAIVEIRDHRRNGVTKDPRVYPLAQASFPTLTANEVRGDHHFLQYPDGPLHWVLRLDVDARFKEHQYNIKRYLSGLSDLSYSFRSHAGFVPYVDASTPGDNLRNHASNDRLGDLHWRRYLIFSSKPDLSQVVLNFGPVGAEVSLQAVDWQKSSAVLGVGGDIEPTYSDHPIKSTWMSAVAKVSVTLDHPSWVLPYSANWQHEMVGSRKVPVLELRIQNLTKSKFSLSNLKLRSVFPVSGEKCKAPENWYVMTVDWIDRSASTELDGHKMAVDIKYVNGHGPPCATDYELDARVPIGNIEIDANSTGGIYLRIDGLPSFEGLGTNTLVDFDSTVSLEKAGGVFPSRIRVGE